MLEKASKSCELKNCNENDRSKSGTEQCGPNANQNRSLRQGLRSRHC